MLVEDGQGGGRLTDGNEFLSPLFPHNIVSISALKVEDGGQPRRRGPTLRTFSGLIWGGGGMVGKLPLGSADHRKERPGDWAISTRRKTRRTRKERAAGLDAMSSDDAAARRSTIDQA